MSLIARHVLANNDQGKRPALSQEATSMLLELAISLHDRERATQEALKAWVLPIAVAIIVGLFGLANVILNRPACP